MLQSSFEKAEFELEDEPRRGRPKETKNGALQIVLDENATQHYIDQLIKFNELQSSSGHLQNPVIYSSTTFHSLQGGRLILNQFEM